MRVRERGLSLLETALAMALFTITFAFVFGIFPASYRASARSRETLLGLQLAHELMAVEQAKSYSSIVDSGPTTVSLPITVNGITVTLVFQISITVAELDPGHVKDILVTVDSESGKAIRLEALAVNV